MSTRQASGWRPDAISRLRSWIAPGPRLPDDITAEMVHLVYASIRPAIIMGAAILLVGMVLYGRNEDPVIAGLAVTGVLLTIGRVLLIRAYRRTGGGNPLPGALARTWDRRYALISYAIAIVVGLLCLRTVLTADVLARTLCIGLLFGYGAGLVARLSSRPRICAGSLFLAVTPVVAGILFNAAADNFQDGVTRVALALLITAFAIGSLETVHHIYSTVVRSLTVRRNLADLARQDALTGLPNRVLLRERFDEDVIRIGRAQPLIALHFLDLDRFKLVNDRFGHPVGDALLKAVAERLAGTLRARDTAARLGGDEFVVLQPGISDPDEARMLALRIVRTVSEPYCIDGHELRIGVSVGIAMVPRDGVDLNVLAARADAALYSAKGDRRGTVAFWNPDLPEVAMGQAA